MKRKNHNNYYRTGVVTLIFMFENIYQIILSNRASQTYFSNQSMRSMKLLLHKIIARLIAQLILRRHSLGELLY